MNKTKYSMFAFTIRPRDGIRPKDITTLDKRLLPKCEYYHVITEKKDSERHIHGCVILKEPQNVSYFNKRMKTFFKYIEDEDRGIWKFAYKGKPWYNEDWYVKYLAKDDNTIILFDKMCSEELRSSLYIDIQVEDRSSRAADPYFAKLERLWNEGPYEIVYDTTPTPLGDVKYPSKNATLRVIERFFAISMYDKRILRCVQDARKLRRLCHTLYHYITKSHTLPWEMDRNGISGTVIAVPQDNPVSGQSVYGNISEP